MNNAYLDTEYSSFYSPDEKKSGEVLQLAVIAVKNGIEVGRFNEYCKPLTNVWNSHAEKVHKISKTFAMKQQHPQQMMDKFFKFIEEFDCIFEVVGHNCRGDKDYLDRLVRKYGENANDWYRRVRPEWGDTAIQSKERKKHLSGIANCKLGTVAEYFGISIDAHDAISDALATWKVHEALKLIHNPNRKADTVQFVHLSEIEKRKKYLDSKYVQMDSDGVVYITKEGTGNKDALRIIMEELWSLYCE